MDMDHPPGTVQSDFTLFDIIDAIHENAPIGVTELAHQLSLSKSTVHKHLKSLETRGFVQNTDGQYTLALRMLEYGGRNRDHNRIFRVGRPKLEEFGRSIDEMIVLSVRDGPFCVMVFRTSERYGLSNVAYLGERIYLHQISAGRSILAEWSDDEIRAYADRTGLPRVVDKTITDIDELFEAIESIRENGIAVTRGERFEGLRAISAAVNDEAGSFGALSIVVPNDSVIAETLEQEYANELIHVAREISLELRYETQ